ncbi:uncharacterized protein EI97DRAFT_501939 [Westerdykella ornata]|uniref:K Homology domain-containing protein n=1 Tax=Westerdykella ornata TaxID=318751 RepID=A0A6A6JGW5_WESOR|nr:uncharacterized protein EI97DRAFT_501939 [Westerdykella ornata]KAF2275343.1 hypothetical protein EI97DRAFT_501939 [Westerdykella ornata]
MASEAVPNGTTSEGLTPAQKLMEQHSHRPTVEEVVDEEDLVHPPSSAPLNASEPAAPLSEKAAGKQKAEGSPAPSKKPEVPFNTASEEMFPALGPVKPRPAAAAPSWGKKPSSGSGVNGNTNGNASSNAASRSSTPAAGMQGPAIMSMPGKDSDSIFFLGNEIIPPKQLKKPVNELIRDINRRSKAKLEYKVGGPQGLVTFTATGPKDAVRQALKDIANEVAAKQTTRVSIPASVRPFIIGKGGAKIQEISKRSGARIQVPKPEPGEDEDTIVDVIIEGNALTNKMAKHEIDNIVKDRTSTVNLRLKNIPAEYYPFLAGPHNSFVNSLENGRDVRVQIPHYTTWNTQAPPQVPRNQPVPFVPQAQLPIQIVGDREHAQAVQAELERQVQRLQQQLAMEQRSIERGRHQFIIGDNGSSLHDFLQETGCTIILPPSHDDSETIYIVGPADRLEAGVNKLEDLAASMQMAIVDAAREHRGAPQSHAYNLSRYLRQRQALEELERLHEASIVAPKGRHGPTAWEIYARNGKNAQKARGDIQSVFASHPPSRFATVNVDPFYHRFLQQRNAQHIRDEHGVHIVFPEDSDDEDLILVYEGLTPSSEYSIPRGPPPASELSAYQRGLEQAQQYIRNLTKAQQNIVSRDIDAPPKFYNKIERYVDKQQQNLPRDTIPVQVSFGDRRPREARRRSNSGVAMRGPADAVEDLAKKILAFIEQEEKDELERGHVTMFEFPQKYANILIGRGGENIRKLREEFDVDIQVQDGQVVLKGPQSKANACKAHILSLAKRLEDEATYVLKIKPQYHRDLIGAKGSQVNRLQDRYKVRINFPRSRANDDDESTAGGASQRNVRNQAADEVVIRGPRKGADEAREELLNLLQWTIDNSYTDTVSVAQSQIPSLIGAGGREMENLRLTTGAQIDVPGAKESNEPSGRAEIKIKGTKKQVEETKKLLQERAKVFDETVVKTIDVDRKHHRTLIGSNGSNIRQIVAAAGGPDNARELARMVRFPRADSAESTIRVEGPMDVVEKIIASIEAQVQSLENQTTETIDVSPDKHRLLIGRGGETRRAIESKFKVQLDIPKQTATGAARNQVKITGEPAQVEKAKEHILDLVKGQEGETVHVPRHLHHFISDNGQFFRRLRNEHKVTVDHGGHEIPSRPAVSEAGKARKTANGGSLPLITDEDAGSGAEERYSWEIIDHNPADAEDTSATIPWILRGPAENLPRAKQALEKAIENASKPKSTGYLILPDPRSYRLVVGPGGSTINSIRKKTGTNVQVPRNQAQGEAIEISGPKEGVEEARKMILEIVNKGGSNGGSGGGRK